MYVTSTYKTKTGRDGLASEDFYMYIDWDKDIDLEILKIARWVKFRKMRKLYFNNLNRYGDKNVMDYLINNCPDKLDIFAFEPNDNYGSGSDYIQGIEKVLY